MESLSKRPERLSTSRDLVEGKQAEDCYLVTFDDSSVDVYRNARLILRKLNIKSTIFVPSSKFSSNPDVS